MTGYVYDADGTKHTLPKLLRWKIIRTDGVPADGFSVTFRYEAKWEAILKKANRFEARQAEEIRFFGVLDEYEIRFDETGLLVTVMGRGMMGILMDNQVALREFYWVSLEDILSNYVRPYGVGKIQYQSNFRLGTFVVEYGETAWQALFGFCQWAAGVTPRFLGDGTLVIGADYEKPRELAHPEKIESAVFSGCRYGVYSQVIAKNMATGLESTVQNSAFIQLGGCATRRVTIPRKNTCRAGNCAPAQILKTSAEGWRRLKLKLGSEVFAAEPGENIRLRLDSMGIQGVFWVESVESAQDEMGSSCILTMREL